MVESNITAEHPTVHTYAGPAYLVQNRKINCFTGISAPTDRYVDAVCQEANYTDEALSHWVESLVNSEVKLRSQKINNDPFVHIRCWGHSIIIKNEAANCPPYPFRLPSSVPWQTSDNIKHSPSVMELWANITEIPYIKVAPAEDAKLKAKVHFGKEIALFDPTQAVNQMRDLRREIKRQQEELSRQEANITTEMETNTAIKLTKSVALTFRALFFSLLLVTLVFSGVSYGLYYRRAKIHQRRHEQLLKTVVNGFDGAGAYEAIQLANREQEQQQRRQNILRQFLSRNEPQVPAVC